MFKQYYILLIYIIFVVFTLSSSPLAYSNLKVDAQYYVVRPDLRLCSRPMCGGYILSRLNGEEGEKEIYVAELLFDTATNPRIDPGKVRDLISDDAKSVIVRGFFQKNSNNGLYKDLFVLNYFKSLPPPPPNAMDSPSTTAASSPPPKTRFYRVDKIESLETSSSGVTLTEVHTGKSHYNVKYQDRYIQNFALLDKKWYSSRFHDIENPETNTIVEATVDGGSITMIHSFVHLPDPKHECPNWTKRPTCPKGQTPTYTRDTNRCLVFDKCTHQGPCPLYVPKCSNRYKMFSYPSSSNACPHWVCDAEFLDTTKKPL